MRLSYEFVEEGKVVEIMRGNANINKPVVETQAKSAISLPAVTAEEAAMGYE